MVDPKIISIRDALVDMAAEMTVDNGFFFDWSVENREDLSRKGNGVCLSIAFSDESNIDERLAVGTREYYQQRDFTFKINLRKGSPLIKTDEVQIIAQEKIEKAVHDLKMKFNSTLNAAGDAGANELQYRGFAYVEEKTQQKYSPLAANVFFRVKYNERRFPI